MANFLNLVNNNGVSVLVDFENLKNNRPVFRAECNNIVYAPEANFKPLQGGQRMYQKYIDEYTRLIPSAREVFEAMAKSFIPATVPVPVPVPAPANALGDKLTELFLETLAKASVEDVFSKCVPMLEEHIRNTYGSLPQRIVVETPKGSTQFTGLTHQMFEKVLQATCNDIPCFLTGPAGTGKSYLCKQVAEALKIPFYFSNALTQEYKVTGFVDANGTYHDTPFYNAFKTGGLFMLDEVDASVPEVLVLINDAIANKRFAFPNGEQLEAHEDFRVITAGNTFGTGADAEYCGRYQLDASTLNRYIIIPIGYDERLEKALTNDNTELIKFAHQFRTACDSAGIKHLCTYRNLTQINKLEEVFNDLAFTLQSCLTKNLATDDLRIICNKMETRNKYYHALKALADA